MSGSGGSRKRKSGAAKRRAIITSEDDDDPDFKGGDSSDQEEDNDDGGVNDDSDSDVQTKKKKKPKRRLAQSDDSSDDSDSEKPKKKRRRIRSNSDSNSGGEDNQSRVGRHNIRKVIKDKNLADETKEAAAEERERRKRMEERQAIYNKMFKLDTVGEGGSSGAINQLILDFDENTKKTIIEVNKKIATKLKPHQARGVKFMWDACFESVEQIKSGKVPGGAILAHCMGLGKTLQTITLTHTVLDNEKTKIDRVLVICPVNTVKNWEDEFDKWLKGRIVINVIYFSLCSGH